MKRAALLGIGVIGLLGANAPANAALTCSSGSILGAGSCTETVSLVPTLTDLNNVSLTLDKWISNASAGNVETLLNVVFTVTANLNSSGTLTNTSASTQTFKFGLSTDFIFSPGAGAPANFLVPTIDVAASFLSGTIVLGPGASTGIAPSLTASNGPNTISTGLAGYIGPGTFALLVSTLTGESFLGGGGNIAASLVTNASPQIDLTYNFINETAQTPTPLPGALSLFASGVGAFGLLRWSKKRKQAARIA